MRIPFSKQTTYVPEWRGNDKLAPADQITATIRPMNVADLIFLIDAFNEAGVAGETEVSDMSTDQLKPIVKTTGHLLPTYVDVQNLFDDEGNILDVDSVVGFPFFLNLAAELLMKLSEFSSPSDDDMGNSSAPPDGEATP